MNNIVKILSIIDRNAIFCFDKYYNTNIKKKKIRINLIINKFSVPPTQRLNLYPVLNLIGYENFFKIAIHFISSYIRNLASICIYRKKFPFISFSFSFSSEQILHSIVINNSTLIYFQSTLENIEYVRKNFLNIIFSSLKRKILSNKSYYKFPKILVVIYNQTVLIQIIRKIFNSIKQIDFKKKFLETKEHKNDNFIWLKNGKLISPADKRVIFSDGNQDFLEISISLNKKIFHMKVINNYSDIIFLSPLSIRNFSSVKKKKLLSKLRFCFFDDLHKLAMQNYENFLYILKQVILYNKNIYLTFEKNFLQFFACSNLIYSGFHNILFNLTKNGFYFFHQFKTERSIDYLKEKNYYFIKFNTKKNEKISGKRLEKFITEFLHKLKLNYSSSIFIFFRSYSEYVLVRNMIWKLKNNNRLNLVPFNEYTSLVNTTNLKRFYKKKIEIVFVTERFFFFKRFFMKKFSKVIFYSIPMNWEFFFEVCSIVNLKAKIFLLLHISDFETVEKIFGFKKTQDIFAKNFHS